MRPKNNLRIRGVEVGLTAALLLGASACEGAEHTPDPGGQGMSKLVAGCKIFRLYAQNRFEPYGAAVRTVPSVMAPKSKTVSFAPNEVIPIDGWEHTGEVAYPDEPSKVLRSDVWYHVAPIGTSRNHDINKAWVNFAAVRSEPTAHDKTGGYSLHLGKIAPTPAACEITPAVDVP